MRSETVRPGCERGNAASSEPRGPDVEYVEFPHNWNVIDTALIAAGLVTIVVAFLVWPGER